MNRFYRSALLFSVIAGSAFCGTSIGTITSAEPFALDGHSVNTPGVSSFPVVVGDTVATSRGPAVLKFADGSAVKLGSNSSVRIAGVEAQPKVLLLSGALDYRLVPGSSVSVTNLDSEHRAGPAAIESRRVYAAESSSSLHLRPGQIAKPAPIGQSAADANSSSADYLGADTTTLGNWKGKYGSDGQYIAGDVTSPPSYAKLTMSGAATSILATDANDPRALQAASGTATRDLSAYSNNFTVDLNLTDGNVHKISFYLADFDNLGRAETFTIIDPATKNVLSTQTFSGFYGGIFESWDIKGHVQIQITSTGKANAIVNGIFFDAAGPAGPQPSNTGATPAPNATNPVAIDPRFLIPLAGLAAAGIATGLLSLPAASANQ